MWRGQGQGRGEGVGLLKQQVEEEADEVDRDERTLGGA